MQIRRLFKQVLHTLLPLFLLTVAFNASAWPNKPIHIIVPFPPGSASDLIARTLAEKLQTRFSNAMVVENRPGAGGTIATTELAKSAKDGYAIMIGTMGTHAIAPSLYKGLAVDYQRDLVPISIVAELPLLVVATRELPINSMQDLVNLAVAGIAQVKAGKLRALAVAAPQRSPIAPDVPTMAEAGFPGIDSTLWIAVFVATGTPPEILNTLNSEINQSMQQAEAKEKLAALGATVLGTSLDSASKRFRDDTAKWQQVTRRPGLTHQLLTRNAFIRPNSGLSGSAPFQSFCIWP